MEIKMTKKNYDELKKDIVLSAMYNDDFEELYRKFNDFLPELTDEQFDLLHIDLETICGMFNNYACSQAFQLSEMYDLGYEGQFDDLVEEITEADEFDYDGDFADNYIGYTEDDNYIYFRDKEYLVNRLVKETGFYYKSYKSWCCDLAELFRVDEFNCCEYGKRI